MVLGFCVPVKRRHPGRGRGLAQEFEHRFRPLSSGFAIPVFAFFSAGVSVVGMESAGELFLDPVFWGIVIGLVVGKPIGIMGSTWVLTKFTKASLDEDTKWGDLLGVTLLAGIGFTVSLLVSELSFGLQSPHYEHAKVAILIGSFVAAILGALCWCRVTAATGSSTNVKPGTKTRTGSRTSTSRTADLLTPPAGVSPVRQLS